MINYRHHIGTPVRPSTRERKCVIRLTEESRGRNLTAKQKNLSLCMPNLTVMEIGEQIRRLSDLRKGDHAVERLALCGERAIEPLREFLMNGAPSHIYQPRQRAVHALARLGAHEILLEYLMMPKNIPDPVIRFGEEAVENTAARALAFWQTEDVFTALLGIAYTRMLPGIIETLASFQRWEPIPLFIAALMDDVSRTAAENALKSMGEVAIPAVMEVISMPHSPNHCESPSALLRRRSAMHILAELKVGTGEWPKINGLLTDADPEIAVSAARIALKIAGPEETRAAIQTLIRKIPHVNWRTRTVIKTCLINHYGVAQKEIADQIAHAKLQSQDAQVCDRTLQLLLTVQKCVGVSATHAG